jgi:hypothetical protein
VSHNLPFNCRPHYPDTFHFKRRPACARKAKINAIDMCGGRTPELYEDSPDTGGGSTPF